LELINSIFVSTNLPNLLQAVSSAERLIPKGKTDKILSAQHVWKVAKQLVTLREEVQSEAAVLAKKHQVNEAQPTQQVEMWRAPDGKLASESPNLDVFFAISKQLCYGYGPGKKDSKSYRANNRNMVSTLNGMLYGAPVSALVSNGAKKLRELSITFKSELEDLCNWTPGSGYMD
jgi:hypothetical protein